MPNDLPPGTTQADLDRHADERAGEDDGYERFLDECERECRCCGECGGAGIPCAGVTAGGMCDQMCFCDGDGFRYDDDERDYDGFPEDYDND